MRRSSLGLSDSLHLSLSAQLGLKADLRPAVSWRLTASRSRSSCLKINRS